MNITLNEGRMRRKIILSIFTLMPLFSFAREMPKEHPKKAEIIKVKAEEF